MKKYILLLFIFCLQLMPTKAQWVTIPDTNFVNKLTQLYPSCMNGNLMDTTCNDIYNTFGLILSNLNISDLSGIEYFNNLDYLNCFNNNLTTITALPNNLVYLRLDNNHLSSLPSLPSNLKSLTCSNNQLNSLPTLPNTLTELDCNINQLSNLPSLPFNLKYLGCGNNQITFLPTLPDSLEYLNCSYNLLVNLPAFSTNLRHFDCSNNEISDLPNINDSLKYLYCSNNPLYALPNLLMNLQSLVCDNNHLSQLPTLPNTLGILSCNENQLTYLPTLPNSLGILECNNNLIPNLPALPNMITTLKCSHNQLTSVPPTPLNMMRFDVSNNNINCFNFYLPIISYAPNGNISNNPITCVPNQTNYSLGIPLCINNDPINNPDNCPELTNITYIRSENTNHGDQLNLYPNPAQQQLNIALQNGLILQYNIVDAFGQEEIMFKNRSQTSMQLDISNLSAGVYFVKVRSSAGSYTAKFIKAE